METVGLFLQFIVFLNVLLGVFNLIPIPPLDGSRILSGLLPNRLAWQYNQLEPHGFYILIALLYFKILNVLLEFPMYVAQKLFMSIAGL